MTTSCPRCGAIYDGRTTACAICDPHSTDPAPWRVVDNTLERGRWVKLPDGQRQWQGPQRGGSYVLPTLPLNADGGAQMHTWVIGPDGVMRRQWWRQVGWHGQTGRVYALTDNPRSTEPGGWYPLWHLIENEAPPAPEEAAEAVNYCWRSGECVLPGGHDGGCDWGQDEEDEDA